MNKPEPLERDDALRERWEQRALDEGSSKTSVLFRGLPEILNQYIHDFHEEILVTHCLPQIKSGAFVLELGCGYGRVTEIINRHCDNIQIVGLDFSCHYCSLYNKQTNCNAVCADLTDAPFPDRSFDCIIAVTSLMYIQTENRDRTMRNIAALLKPDGIGFFLDPGQKYMDMVGLINPSRRKHTTGGYGFTSKEYDKLGHADGLDIIQRGGMTFFSLAMPLLLLMQHFEPLLNPVLKLTDWLDKTFHSLHFLSLHQWMLVKKTAIDN